MKQMPMIQKVMTTLPHTIGQDIPLKTAMSLMREYGIRHLPVLEASRVVGVLTDRDVKLAASFAPQGAQADALTVEDVMTPEPYTVAPETPLNHVVTEMAEHKYGCAIVQQANGKVVGIFTAVDGLRTLGETLGAFYRSAS